ncbi:MAG: hypothetical protein ACE37F_03915 [Nannocystaceae bacterium]|nr:hypothetical protein [bacterium]
MPTKTASLLLLAAALWAAPACAHKAPKIDAPLGRVVVYRNGVAYFERRATVDGSFSLDVPRGRVDDFLKSLTVVDLSDGSPLSVSYQTPDRSSARSVSMKIVLPPGKRDVLITYVTESPAWKPSYRLMLGDDGKAQLQSLAVVDNVSNEEWEGVRVGVGTTSALSFRYDLHSVRMVERETVDDGTLIAQAPPTGGSAYAVDGAHKRVIANVGLDDLEGFAVSMDDFRNIPTGSSTGRDYTAVVEASATVTMEESGVALAGASSAESKSELAGADEPDEPPPEPPVMRLVNQLQGNADRIRIEGYRMDGEADTSSALRRANTLRETLVANGIDSARIEVAEGRGTVEDSSDVLRVTAVDEVLQMTQAVGDGDDEAPRGSALFLAKQPLSLEVGHSAMVTLLEAETSAHRVYVYDPASERGSTRFAFNAVRITNPTDHTLDPGPFTVYAKDQFLGEGIAEPIPPRANALVPYALDRTLRVRTQEETQDDIQRLIDVQRGVATTDTQRVRSTTFRLHNRGAQRATVYIRHRVPSGWKEHDLPKNAQRYGDDVLVPVDVEGNEHATLTLRDTMPLQSTLNLRATKDLVMVKRYLASGDAPPSVAPQLRALVDAHERAQALHEKLHAAQEQVGALRIRTQELRDQLVLLRKSKKAQSLSSHLAKRMREVSDELDAALLVVSGLKNERLAAHIQLSTIVADLAVDDELAVR